MKILSLDGGGVRGFITTRILNRFHLDVSSIDVFSGTSTGALIAVSLAMGWSLDKISRFFRIHTPFIFQENIIEKIQDLNGLIASRYSNEKLKHTIQKAFGDKTLKDIPKTVFIHTFYVGDQESKPWTPVVFSNIDEQYADMTIVDALMKSTAVPVYFPIYQGYVDGGVYCNNPAVSTIGLCIKWFGVSIHDILLLSVGTGIVPFYIPSSDHNANWGTMDWISNEHLLNILLDSQLKATHQYCKNILDDRYHRIQPLLKTEIRLDSTDSFDEMNRIANEYDTSQDTDWIKTFF